MAFYGIPSTGGTTTAASSNDTIYLGVDQLNPQSATLLGVDGNDVIYLGAQGYTATASGNVPAQTIELRTGASATADTASGSITVSGALIASSIATTGITKTWSGLIGPSGQLVIAAQNWKLTGIVTSNRAARTLVGTNLYGNAGNDSIYLGESITGMSAVSVGGGAGDDYIGNATYVNETFVTGSTFNITTAENVTLEGGGGNDTIAIYDAAGDHVIKSATIAGGQGNDSINLGITSAEYTKGIVAAGGGNDTLTMIGGSASAVSVAGGGGNDSITFNFQTADNVFIGGDVDGLAQSDYDGDDTIAGAISGGSGQTIFGGGGNDSITLTLEASEKYLFAGNAGNDTILIDSGSLLKTGSIQAGAGTDLIDLSGAGVNSGLSIWGGGGNDTIRLGVQHLHTGTDVGRVYGGEGADQIIGTGSASVNLMTYGYSGYSDSTLASMDTIYGGDGTGDTVALAFTEGGLTRASNFDVSGATGTNGVVIFTGDGTYAELTARVNFLDSQVTTTGATVTFKDASNVAYVFSQGGSDDLLVKLNGTALGALGLTVSTVGSESIVSAARLAN